MRELLLSVRGTVLSTISMGHPSQAFRETSHQWHHSGCLLTLQRATATNAADSYWGTASWPARTSPKALFRKTTRQTASRRSGPSCTLLPAILLVADSGMRHGFLRTHCFQMTKIIRRNIVSIEFNRTT